VVATVDGGAPVTVSRAEKPRNAGPGSPAEHAAATISTSPDRAVDWEARQRTGHECEQSAAHCGEWPAAAQHHSVRRQRGSTAVIRRICRLIRFRRLVGRSLALQLSRLRFFLKFLQLFCLLGTGVAITLGALLPVIDFEGHAGLPFYDHNHC